jgi:hypothetical protein
MTRPSAEQLAQAKKWAWSKYAEGRPEHLNGCGCDIEFQHCAFLAVDILAAELEHVEREYLSAIDSMIYCPIVLKEFCKNCEQETKKEVA